jgi:Ca2+-transporting ATPase
MKKVIVYLMADSFSAVLIILGALLLGLPLPLTAAQILWINLLTDSFPYMALTFEKGEDDVMQRGPTRGPILDNEMKALIFIISIVVDILSLGLYWYYIKTVGDIAFARTIVFALFGSSTLLYSFSCKSLRKPLWKSNPLDNKFLIWGVGAGFVLLFSSIYIPVLSGLLKVERLFLEDWILVLSLVMFKVLLIEAVKYYYYRFDKV